MSDFPSGFCLDCNQVLFHFCGCALFVFLLWMLFLFSHWNWQDFFGRKKKPRHFPIYGVSSLFFSFFVWLTFSVWKNSFSDCDAIFLRPSLKSLKSTRFLFPLSVAVATDFKLIT